MNKILLHNSIISHTIMTFARSSGAGGQNVNKVNTKVHAVLSVLDIEGLTEMELKLVKERLGGLINKEGNICIDVQDERFQNKNREMALERMENKIVEAAKIQKKRTATKPSKASRERRLKLKKSRSEIKKNRAKIF